MFNFEFCCILLYFNLLKCMKEVTKMGKSQNFEFTKKTECLTGLTKCTVRGKLSENELIKIIKNLSSFLFELFSQRMNSRKWGEDFFAWVPPRTYKI